MEDSPQKRAGFSIVQTVIALAVVLILAALVLPSTLSTGDHHSRLYTVLSDGRQIHQATYRMVLDGLAGEPPSPGWPGDLAVAEEKPVTTAGQFVERLVELKYLDRGSLAKLFQAPGGPVYPGTGSFEGKYNPYFFFKVTGKDGDDAIFLTTKNFRYGAPLDAQGPYGDIACVIVRKGGDAHMLMNSQARNKTIGVMPGGTAENPGEQDGNILKDE